MIQTSLITYVLIVLILVASYCLWVYIASVMKFKFIAFDFLFGSLILYPLLARAIGFFSHISFYVNQGFSIFPFIQNAQGDTKLSSSLPWAFFKIWDGNLYIFSLIFVLLITQQILKKAHPKIKLRNEAMFIANLNIFSAIFYLLVSFYSIFNDFGSLEFNVDLLSDEQKALIIIVLGYVLLMLLLKVLLRKREKVFLQSNWVSFLIFVTIIVSFEATELSLNFVMFISCIIFITGYLSYSFYRALNTKIIR